ncbi:hypothetical protein ACQZV8_08665 [Magnetococcales bacterium HHB-1]
MANIDFKKNIAQLIREHPELGVVLAEMKIQCADCLASQVDTLNDVIRMYRLDAKELMARVEKAQKT